MSAPEHAEDVLGFVTRAVHAGQEPDPATGAVVPPLHLSTTFRRDDLETRPRWEYSRCGNPTREALETCLATLEGARHALAFASGLAASSAVLSLLVPGDHVVASEDLYGGTVRLFERVFARIGVRFSYADGTVPDALAGVLTPETRMLWVESPGNPLLRLTDIGAAADIAHSAGALLVVDNTFASPCLQRPLELGAHIVVHSTTKYLGGHSDVIGGAVALDDRAVHAALRSHQNAVGAVPSPFDCWLLHRGIKTLPLRMRAHCENAARVAELLAAHPAVEAVHYPGLASHPQHDLAERQMRAPGGMVSFVLRGGRRAAEAFLGTLRIFALAESLGGVESLACHPCSMTHASIPPDERDRRAIREGLVRLSVGIEDAEDLLGDVTRGLEAAARTQRV